MSIKPINFMKKAIPIFKYLKNLSVNPFNLMMIKMMIIINLKLTSIVMQL
jgi:hypothetical protein